MSPPSVFVIAEAGVNHDGSLDAALRLVDVAVDSGADAVKFQSFRASALVSKHARKASYQLKTTDRDESQGEMLKRLELSEPAQARLAEHCRARGIRFMSTPFDLRSLDFLVSLDVTPLKISSGDLTYTQLLVRAGRAGRPVILSTGMATLGEVEVALGDLARGYTGKSNSREAFASREGREALVKNVTLLHCTTEYPAPVTAVNLRAMDTLAAAFGLRVGYSDHTTGVAISLAAAARGATMIEKHFTLDKTLPGPDHAASLDPSELALLVRGIREIEAALGQGIKAPSAAEVPNMAVARRSLVALRAVGAGEIFTEENLGAKRPGTGISPTRLDEWLGTIAQRSYEEDELIEPPSHAARP